MTSPNLLQSISRWLSVTLAACVIASQAHAIGLVPSPPELNVTSYILLDAQSGEVLAEKNSDERIHPASLTKMMTAYIAETEITNGNLKPTDLVSVSKKAWSLGGSTMFIEVGEQVPVGELLKGIIIISGNDASVAMAEHIGGSELAFSQMMNAMAHRLGMKNTLFQNASGWPVDDHYSTARDMAILSEHIINDYPEQYSLYSQKSYQYGTDHRTGKPLAAQSNRNRLLWSNKTVDGLKTGFIDETGYHLAVTAKQQDRRLIAVILGAKSEKQRTEDAQKLLNFGFRFFENVALKKAGEPLQTVKVWKGKSKEMSVGIDKDLILTIPRGTENSLSATLVIESVIEAPIAKGQQVGFVKVMLGEELVKEVPLVAQQAVEQGGFFKRVWDSIVLFFAGLFA